MPLTISVNLKDHLAQTTTTLTTCIKIDLIDGSNTSYYFTEHDKKVTYGGNDYIPNAGYIPSSQDTKLDLSVDNMDILGIIDDSSIEAEDLLAGRFDYADAKVFQVNYEDPDGDGELVLIQGKLGQVEVKDNSFTVELRGLTQFFQQSIGTPYTVLCAADFGDAKCALDLDPPEWQASSTYVVGDVAKATSYDGRRYVVISITGTGQSGATEPTWDTDIGDPTVDNEVTWECEDALTKTFTVASVSGGSPKRIFGTSLTDVDNHFDLGLVTWTVGNNQYFKMDVKVYLNTNGEIELYEPMPFDVQIGDAGTISTGCDKKWATCRDRYSNQLNHRGYPYLPGISKILRE